MILQTDCDANYSQTYHKLTIFELIMSAYTRQSKNSAVILPVLSEHDTSEMICDKTKIVAKFGNIFDSSNDNANTIICIPNITDGVLYRLAWSMNGRLIASKTDEAPYASLAVDCNIPNVDSIVLFNYSHTVEKWSDTFESIGSVLKLSTTKPNILVVPTFGVNNGISFYDSALGIFMGLRSALSTSQKLSQLDEIHVVTLYSRNMNDSSCRTIGHLRSMMNLYTKYDKNGAIECMICTTEHANILYNCGHMVVCQSCDKQLVSVYGYNCMCCQANVIERFKCAPIVEINQLCCSKSLVDKDKKKRLTYVPCGHSQLLCNDCEIDVKSWESKCPECDSIVEKALRVYV